jgi:phenylalanyl-tRNA synthetase beta chain
MVLADDLAAGTPLDGVLPVGDDILEIETLYNRPDLTSIYGIAREVAALLGTELRPMPGTDPERAADELVEIAIDDLERCPRYIGRLFRKVRVGESPAWLKARLVGAGMRPISNVVDVTNYVMLALGSPLHAFDHDKLAGGRIVVRRARPGEELETLDGTRRALDGGFLRDEQCAARGGELRAADSPAQRRAPAHAHREPDALGEGRRPGARRAGGHVRLAAARRARRCTLDG